MSQLLLDMQPAPVPTFDNYVVGGNGELLARLRGLADRRSFDAIYLWGPPGSGKSHLLTASADLAAPFRPVQRYRADDFDADLSPVPGALIVVDQADRLCEAGQIALFRIFNAARLAGLALLLSGSQPPTQLGLREDLRTRIGQTLVFELKPLSDDDKADALHRHALLRGMRMDGSLVRYLLHHGRRDLPSLMAVLDQLDVASLQQHRAATLPLLKEVLELQFDDETRSL